MNRRLRGFTLIELLIVLVLIGIMLAVAVPSFTSFIANYRATSAVNDFLQGVTSTRTEALKRGRKVMMVPVGGDWRAGWTVFVDKDGDGAYVAANGDELIYQHGALPASVTVAGSSGPVPFAPANYVAFDGTGYPRLVAPTAGAGGVLTGGIVFGDTTGNLAAPPRRTLCLSNFGRPRVVKDTVETCVNG